MERGMERWLGVCVTSHIAVKTCTCADSFVGTAPGWYGCRNHGYPFGTLVMPRKRVVIPGVGSTGLDDGPYLPGQAPRKRPESKTPEELKAIRAKAWATRRARHNHRVGQT